MSNMIQTMSQADLALVTAGVIEGPNGGGCTDVDQMPVPKFPKISGTTIDVCV